MSLSVPLKDYLDGLTEETAPANGADFLLIKDTSGSVMKKVKPATLFGIYPAHQAADASYTTDNTLNDTDLSLTLPVGFYDIGIKAPSTVGAGGIKWAFAATATLGSASFAKYVIESAGGDTLGPQTVQGSGGRVGSALTSTPFEISSFTGAALILITGSFEVTVAGIVTLQCSQRNSDAAATVFGKNAAFVATKI